MYFISEHWTHFKRELYTVCKVYQNLFLLPEILLQMDDPEQNLWVDSSSGYRLLASYWRADSVQQGLLMCQYCWSLFQEHPEGHIQLLHICLAQYSRWLGHLTTELWMHFCLPILGMCSKHPVAYHHPN